MERNKTMGYIPPKYTTNLSNKKENGLTELEQKAMDKLLECYGIFLKLPSQHPSELPDFVYAVHLIQGLLCKRIVRRLYPKGWPIYNDKNKIKDKNNDIQ